MRNGIDRGHRLGHRCRSRRRPTPEGGALIASTPKATAFNLDLPPARAAGDVVGEPRLKLTYSGTGAPADTHVHAQIVDTARNLVLGNVTTPIPVKLDGQAAHDRAPARARGRPRAWRASATGFRSPPASTLYAAQRSAGPLQLTRVAIALPLIDAKAPPG